MNLRAASTSLRRRAAAVLFDVAGLAIFLAATAFMLATAALFLAGTFAFAALCGLVCLFGKPAGLAVEMGSKT